MGADLTYMQCMYKGVCKDEDIRRLIEERYYRINRVTSGEELTRFFNCLRQNIEYIAIFVKKRLT